MNAKLIFGVNILKFGEKYSTPEPLPDIKSLFPDERSVHATAPAVFNLAVEAEVSVCTMCKSSMWRPNMRWNIQTLETSSIGSGGSSSMSASNAVINAFKSKC